MDIINTIFAAIGYVIAFIAVAAAACFGFGYAVDRCRLTFDAAVSRELDRRLRERGRMMKAQSHWFSDVQQAAMWESCADAMCWGGYPDVGNIRDTLMPAAAARITKERTRP